jgi:hypothetical protein
MRDSLRCAMRCVAILVLPPRLICRRGDTRWMSWLADRYISLRSLRGGAALSLKRSISRGVAVSSQLVELVNSMPEEEHLRSY